MAKLVGKQPGEGHDPFMTGLRDGQLDAQAELPYRPPPGEVNQVDRWQRQYLQGYSAGYARASGLEAGELRPEDRLPVTAPRQPATR